MTSNIVVAAGFIIFRRIQSEIQYLLLKASHGTNHWTPPKGHVDPGEEEFETALRETAEESGLAKEQLNILENFKKTLLYEVRGKPKRVVYWVAELKNVDDPIILSDEHTEYKWLSLKEACLTSQYKDMIEALQVVDQHIRQINKS